MSPEQLEEWQGPARHVGVIDKPNDIEHVHDWILIEGVEFCTRGACLASRDEFGTIEP